MTEAREARRDALAERLLGAGVAAGELLTVYLGARLGFYRALAEGWATATEVARRCGTAERLTREWLDQQAVAELVELDDASAPADARRYRLAEGHAEVLVDPDSLWFTAPIASLVRGVAAVMDRVVESYRTGVGISWAEYGEDHREGMAALNRPGYLARMGPEWIAALPDVHARLASGPAPYVADIGCGTGWSSIAVALAFPSVQVDGFDSDPDAVLAAQANAAGAGVADRVTFHARNVSAEGFERRYELVTFFECVHDMAQPVAALRAAREVLADGGAVLIADSRVHDRFVAPGDLVERYCYASSVLVCLPASYCDGPSVGTGTAMRPATLAQYVVEAGFAGMEILPIDDRFWQFYRLRTR